MGTWASSLASSNKSGLLLQKETAPLVLIISPQPEGGKASRYNHAGAACIGFRVLGFRVLGFRV